MWGDDEGEQDQEFLEEGRDDSDEGEGWQSSPEGEGGEQGAGSKLCSACGMLCLGIAVLPIMLFLLGWNENNYVCEMDKFMYSEDTAVEVGCSNAGNDNKYAFIACPILTSSLKEMGPASFGTLSDVDVSFKTAAASQLVEMYQCVEHSRTETTGKGDNRHTRTIYSYSMDWKDSAETGFSGPLENAKTKCGAAFDKNPYLPSNIEWGTQHDKAESLKLGADPNKIDDPTAFTIGEELIKMLDATEPVNMSPFAECCSISSVPSLGGIVWTHAAPSKVTKDTLVVQGNYLQTCISQKLGCVRISYKKNAAEGLSVMTHVNTAGRTQAQTIPSTWGCKSRTWQTLMERVVSKEDFITALREANHTQTNILRVIGVIGAWLAVWCCFQPISAAADIVGDWLDCIPCVGGCLEDLLETVVDSVICCMSCGIGCSCALWVIAIVWVAMRPLYGGALMAVAVLMCLGVAGVRAACAGGREPSKKRKKKKAQRKRKAAREDEESEEE